MFDFLSRSLVFVFSGISAIGVVVFTLYSFFSSSTSATAQSVPLPTSTFTSQPSNTPTATLTSTPTLTLTRTPTKSPTPTLTQPNTPIPPTATSIFTSTPSVLVVKVNGCDATNKKVEVAGLPANTLKGILVRLPNGATYPLQSVSDDGHGWIEEVSVESIKMNCPATPTPIPRPNTNSSNSSDNNMGMMSAGSGAAAISHDNCAACHSTIPTPKK